jgi:MFS family permease
MEKTEYKVYGYRWVVLFAYMLVAVMNQLLWITFAPITSDAAHFYGVSDLSIGLLSMSFMIVYIFVSIPASWAIDTYGIRVAVGIGAVLTGFFGLMRGLVAPNYTLVLIAQIGIAAGQPFILNAVTKVAARWFPVNERATAAGLGSLAAYLGIMAGLALTPYLALNHDIAYVLMAYGIVAAVAAVVFFVFIKERPATPPCPPEMEARSLVLDGLKDTLRNRGFLFLLTIFFVGLGAFNAVTTWIEDIVRPRGFTATQAGVIGSLMIVGGIFGALAFPALSDHFRKRTPFIFMAIAGATVGLVGITFFSNYILLLSAAFILGFFLLSAGPIGFQYAAEISYPTPEGTSNGLVLLVGQISGILFIFGMDSFRAPGGSMTPALIVLIGLMAVSLFLCTRLKEAPVLLSSGTNAEDVKFHQDMPAD